MSVDIGTGSGLGWINLTTCDSSGASLRLLLPPSRFGDPKGGILRIPSAMGFNPAIGEGEGVSPRNVSNNGSASPCPNAGEPLSSKSTRRKSPTVPDRSRSCYAVSTSPDAIASGLSGHHRRASWGPRTEGALKGTRNPDMGAYSETANLRPISQHSCDPRLRFPVRGRSSLAGLDHDLEKSTPETRANICHQVNAPRRPSCGFHGVQHHSVNFGIGPCHGEAVFRLPRLPIRFRRPFEAGGVEGMDVGCRVHAQGRAPPHVAFGFPRVVPPPYREADRRHHERPRRCPQPPRPPLTAHGWPPAFFRAHSSEWRS